MPVSTYRVSGGVRVEMADLHLDKDEKFLESDDHWRRVVQALDPDVRRDMVGWLKTSIEPSSPSKHGLYSIMLEYLRGAANVSSIIPVTLQPYRSSNNEILARDFATVSEDARVVLSAVKKALAAKAIQKALEAGGIRFEANSVGGPIAGQKTVESS